MLIFLLGLFALGETVNLNLKTPSDLSIYKNSIYIVDGLKQEILVLNKNTLKPKNKIKLKFKPYGIYVEDNKIYLTSPKDKKIYILNLKGKIERVINLKASPIDLVKVKNLIWTSLKNGYLKAYSLDGKERKSINFNSKLGFLTKDNSYIYLVDVNNAKIYLIDFNGKLTYFFGDFGITKGKLFRPTGIDVDKNYIYVADPIFKKVVVFTKAGSYVGYFSNIKNPLGLKVDKNNIYVLDSLKPTLVIRKKNEVER